MRKRKRREERRKEIPNRLLSLSAHRLSAPSVKHSSCQQIYGRTTKQREEKENEKGEGKRQREKGTRGRRRHQSTRKEFNP